MSRAFRMASLEANVGERSDEVYLPTKDGVGIACPMNPGDPTLGVPGSEWVYC